MAQFDAAAAKAAGYSDEEIAAFGKQLQAAKAAGYSDDDILSHLQGATAPKAPAAPATQVNPADAQMPAGSWGQYNEAAQGLTLGAWPYVKAAAKRVLMPQNYLGSALGLMPQAQGFSEDIAQAKQAQAGWEAEHPVAAAVDKFAGSLPAALYTQGRAPAVQLPAVLGAVGKYAAPVLTGLYKGALIGAETSNLNNGNNGNMLQDTAVGGALGAGFSGAGQIVRAGLRSTIAPEIGRMAGRSAAAGLDLRLGQQSQSGVVRGLDAAIFGPQPAQHTALNRALSSTFGADLETLTGENLGKARSALSSRYQQVTPQLSAVLDSSRDPGYMADLTSIMQPMNLAGLDRSAVNKVRSVITAIGSAAPNGDLSGPAFQRIIKEGGPISKLLADDNTKAIGGQLREALTNAVLRSSPPDAAAEFGQLNQQWKNLHVIQKVAERMGASGQLQPQQLLPAIARGYKDYGWQTPSTIQTLAEAGQLLPKVAKTGEPIAAHGMLRRIGVPAALAGGIGAAAYEGVGQGLSMAASNPQLALEGGAGLLGLALGRKGLQTALANPKQTSALMLPLSIEAVNQLLAVPAQKK